MLKGETAAGAWIGNRFYLLSADAAGNWRLRVLDAAYPHLQLLPVAVRSDLNRIPRPVLPDAIAIGERLVTYEQFGHKLDRRAASEQVPGGFIVVDPKSGDATDRLTARGHFSQMLAGPDGQYLYGLDVADPLWKQVQIVKVDASSGAVIQSKRLDDGVWFLAAGTIPPGMAGRLDLRASIR